jgi:hypothetical protein
MTMAFVIFMAGDADVLRLAHLYQLAHCERETMFMTLVGNLGWSEISGIHLSVGTTKGQLFICLSSATVISTSKIIGLLGTRSGLTGRARSSWTGF